VLAINDHIKDKVKMIKFIKIVVDKILERKENQQIIKHTLKPDVKNKKFQI